MKPINSIPTKNTRLLAAFAGLALAAGSADGSLLVYEGFDYGAAGADRISSDSLHLQPDGGGGDGNATGLGGSWSDSSGPDDGSGLFMASGSLSFGDMATSGNHVRSDTNSNNDIFSRSITAALPTSGELWFSFAADKIQNNFSAAEGGLVIGNQTVGNARIFENTGADGLQGFGIAPTTSGNNWTAYGWNGTSQVVGGTALTVSVGGGDVRLLVGQISFDTGTSGADVFTLHEYELSGSGTIAGGTLTEVTSLEVDADQSLLDTLNLTRQVNTSYDEIRIGTTLDDVVTAVPEPSAFALLAGCFGLTWVMVRRRS